MTETINNEPATKGDLADLRTELKTDINRIDQKLGQMDTTLRSLSTTVHSLGVEVSKTNLHMDPLENNIMTELRSFKSDLLSAYEASVMKGQLYSQKAMPHADMLSGHEEKLLNHETRLASLETK